MPVAIRQNGGVLQPLSFVLFGQLLDGSSNVATNYSIYICHIIGYIVTPNTKFTALIHSCYPFGKCFALFFASASLLPFCFQNQCLSIIQFNKKIGGIFFFGGAIILRR